MVSPLSFMMPVQQFFRSMKDRQFLAIAGETFLIHDYFLTFPLEVDYMWNSPWSLVKSIFLLNRYGNLIGQTLYTLEELGILSQGSKKFCFHFQWYVAVFGVLSQESIHILVLLRAWAIWGCKYYLAIAMCIAYGLYLSAFTVTVVVQLMAVNLKLVTFAYLAETGVCFLPTSSSTFQWILPLVSGLLDAIVTVMVAYSLVKLLRGTLSSQPSLVLRVLVKDAVLYFLVDIAVVTAGIMSRTFYARDPRNMLSVPLLPLITVAGQRVVLNLRRLRPRTPTVQTRDRNIIETGPAVGWRSVEFRLTDDLRDRDEAEHRQSVDHESAIELLVVEDPRT